MFQTNMLDQSCLVSMTLHLTMVIMLNMQSTTCVVGDELPVTMEYLGEADLNLEFLNFSHSTTTLTTTTMSVPLLSRRPSQYWYVSAEQGDEKMTCGGTPSHPCSTLQNVLPRVGSGDTVHMAAGSSPKSTWYEICNFTQVITGDLYIKGWQGIPNIGCSLPRDKMNNKLKLVSQSEGFVSSLYLSNLAFHYILVDIADTNLRIENCSFMGLGLSVFSQANISIEVERCLFYGNITCSRGECVPTASLRTLGRIITHDIKNNVFNNVQLSLFTMRGVGKVVNIEDCLFDGHPDPSDIPVNSYAEVSVQSLEANVTVRRCRFQNIYHWNPIESVMNLFHGSFLMRLYSMVSRNFQSDPNNVRFLISECHFENNERGITIQGSPSSLVVEHSSFINNIAIHAGAAILHLSDEHTLVHNCTFRGNQAGAFRITEVRNRGDVFLVRGDEVYIYSLCCKGSISLIGKGGAIRLQKGSMKIEDSNFSNNTARLLGGAIFVDQFGVLTLNNTILSNSDSHIHSSQGDIIYSNGKVTVEGVGLYIKTAKNHISLLQHSGKQWSIGVYEVTVHCPIGHGLRVVNTSSFRIVPEVGLQRSYQLDQLSYFCESCPRHKYSTDSGYLHYKLNPKYDHYFTLMINESEPSYDFDGEYKFNEIRCQECPYGAACDNAIRALPNFWGYRWNGSVRFQSCPKGYCCAKSQCETYNICANNRAGRLCSKCRDGYSEALFSSTCVPNTSCGPFWIWPFAAGMGFVYMIFLLYQKDARDFIFQKPEYIPCREQKVSQSLPGPSGIETILLNGKTNDEEQSHVEQNATATDELIEQKVDIRGSGDERSKEDEAVKPTGNLDMGGIYLVIIMYYFQDAMLLNVKTASTTVENKARSQLKTVLLGFFKFRLEVAHFIDNVCLLPGMTSSVKLLSRTVLVPYTILLFVLVFIIYKISRCCVAKKEEGEDKFLTKMSSGFMLCLLFTYQKLATTAFTLLNCVPVEHDWVLFIDGSVTCYQYWQYGVLAYALICIVPFCLVLLLGPGLLREGHINLMCFFLACLIPLPFVLYFAIFRLLQNNRSNKESSQFSNQAKAVYKVLQAPFNDIQGRYLGAYCWSGVLIGRRLVLVLIYTFVNNSLIRILSMLFFCFLLLLHHVNVQPYNSTGGNMAGSISLAAMMVIGGINLIRAAFEASEYNPQGPNKTLMKVMDETENVLMFWFPLAIMCMVLLALSVKITLLVLSYCMKDSDKRKSESQ